MTTFLLGGGLLGGQQITATEVDRIGREIEQQLSDPNRRTDALELIEQLRTETSNYEQRFVESTEELNQLYLQHAANRFQMQQALEVLNTEWYVSQHGSLKLAYKLRESVSAEEWAVIFAPR